MTKNVFTIPPDAAFIDCLAEGLWREAGADPFKLSETLVLLPTRRSCRYLRMAFPRIVKSRAALLPRMQPLGDLDEEELYFTSAAIADIPPAISPLRRQLLLAQLVQKKDATMPLDQAAQLAEALGRLIDEVQTERLAFAGLEKLAPEDLAEHWRQTLKFLDIVTEAWPAHLKKEGCIDPAARRNRVIEAQAEAWRTHPPAYPVIAAGSTGSLPATRDLLDVIASLPKGSVVLPGLDTGLEKEAWQEVGETHPQFTIKQLLEKLGIDRKDVKPYSCAKTGYEARVRLIQESMRPAETTEAWRNLDPKKLAGATEGISRLTLDTAENEAQAIALLMRAALEVPEKTATLVTPDRALAERVAAQLARWDIAANDSAGASLAAQPAGSFLLDVLTAADPDATPIDHLSLLKHPSAAFGLDPAACRALARDIEIGLWRKDDRSPKDPQHIRSRDELLQDFQPLQKIWRKAKPLADWITLHRETAEQCATSDRETGAARLWKNDDGEAAAAWLEEWQTAASGFPQLDGSEYASLFAGLLRKVTMRPSYGQHPRLSILGPLEARLLQADLTILGGLNEGSWPPEAAVDPWMSRPMKRDFGLPQPERRIGLSAHDFVQLASGPEVVLTRARRAGNAPTVPSRFLLQLETVLKALGREDDALAAIEPWESWTRLLDEPEDITPCDAPSPRPPAEARPQSLNVTDIGNWRRNPYAIYAKHVLRLRKIKPLEADATAADKGTIIHAALDRFIRRYPDTLPLHALEELIKLGHEVFAPYRDQPQAAAFWWPRFERIAGWFIEQEHERRAEGIKNLKSEAEGSITLKNNFTLKGRADRVDKLPDGTLAIIDYKTGAVPSQTEIRAGYEPQLPLLALIASEGGFKDVPATPVAALTHWKLSGGAEAAEEKPVKPPFETLISSARAGLENLITRFADPATPYEAAPKPGVQPRYDDYAHLARLAEWGRTAEDV